MSLNFGLLYTRVAILKEPRRTQQQYSRTTCPRGRLTSPRTECAHRTQYVLRELVRVTLFKTDIIHGSSCITYSATAPQCGWVRYAVRSCLGSCIREYELGVCAERFLKVFQWTTRRTLQRNTVVPYTEYYGLLYYTQGPPVSGVQPSSYPLPNCWFQKQNIVHKRFKRYITVIDFAPYHF